MKRLGVNIDLVATLRNVRGEFYPDPTNFRTFHVKAPRPYSSRERLASCNASFGPSRFLLVKGLSMPFFFILCI